MPINVDFAAGPKHYEGFRESKHILVTSMFRTLQGEAPFAGHPSVFLRLAGCNYGGKNLACAWCDTAFQFHLGKKLHFSELTKQLEAIRKPGDMLVITGGEPTLQVALLDWLRWQDLSWAAIQFETNGTQYKFFDEYESATFPAEIEFVVSPKALYKTGKYPKIQPVVLRNATCLKFVLEPDETSPQHTVPDWALDQTLISPLANEDPVPVYVSPAAYYLRTPTSETASAWDPTLIDQKKTAESYAYAAEYAMANDLRLSIQTHLFAAVP